VARSISGFPCHCYAKEHALQKVHVVRQCTLKLVVLQNKNYKRTCLEHMSTTQN
jgi:hypothetical protein